MRRRHLTAQQKGQIIIDIENGKSLPLPSNRVLAEKAGVSERTIARVAAVQDNEEMKANYP